MFWFRKWQLYIVVQVNLFLMFVVVAVSVKCVSVDRVYVGSFMTSLEMAGVSLTLLLLDETRERALGELSIGKQTVFN